MRRCVTLSVYSKTLAHPSRFAAYLSDTKLRGIQTAGGDGKQKTGTEVTRSSPKAGASPRAAAFQSERAHDRFIRGHSTSAAAETEQEADTVGPTGNLFNAEIDPTLVGKYASTRRTFGPRSNAQAMLACGGPVLASQSSFDPNYEGAKNWIRNHAVGPAVLSPVLLSGLIGALVEAAVPRSVPIGWSMRQVRPLIVGVEICAKITVESVKDSSSDSELGEACSVPRGGTSDDSVDDRFRRKHGYEVLLRTKASRVRDDETIAEGCHTIWIPDYMNM